MTKLMDRVLQRVGIRQTPDRTFPVLFVKFKEILSLNNQVLERIATANAMLSGDYLFDQQYILATCEEITSLVERLVYNLDSLAPGKYPGLHGAFNRIQLDIREELSGQSTRSGGSFVLPYEGISRYAVDAVGGKNATLAEIGNALHIPTPRGFAISVSAYNAFLDANGLRPFIEEALGEWREGVSTVADVSQRIRARIRSSVMPESVRRALTLAIAALLGGKPGHLAFRSSAVGEDGEQSFAGQYMSVLNVTPSDAIEAYRQVLESLFSESALEYARRMGFKNHEIGMAVACQTVIDARTSGVLYTQDPVAPQRDQMLINATWGLGGPAVSGEARTDQFTVSRARGHETIAVNLVRKQTSLRPKSGGGTARMPVAAELQTMPALTREEIGVLVQTALRIERYFRKPQDIEFAFDGEGRLTILQTRRLTIRPEPTVRAEDLANLDQRYTVLMRNQGVIARKGIALGKVHLVKAEEDLADFPDGAILVARYASPVFAKVLAKAAGIITDVGAATGHLATVAREFRLPAIFNCENATERLAEGTEITMDADENIVYRGTVKELGQYRMAEAPMEDAYEFRLLRRVLRKIEPLRLLDPSEDNFVPEACRSLHDITRFVHEKAVQALIDFHVYNTARPGSGSGRLLWNIPLDLVVIDIGGGLKGEVGQNVGIEDVKSEPMRALLKGMALPGAWSNDPMSVDFAGFMSSLTRTFSAELSGPKNVGQNLAVVSREYANVSLRLGYHFTMIDAYVSEHVGDNYIYFRFFGGVTEESRRSRRARLLAAILAAKDFRVEVHGDLVIGRVKKIDRAGIISRLTVLGALVGFTRQLDVRMVDEQRIAAFVEGFNSLLEEDNE